MALSHVCFQCGFDLARCHIESDHHYSLPIIICPKCDTKHVRRRHPALRTARACCRVRKGLWHLGWRALVAVFVYLAVFDVIRGITGEMDKTWRLLAGPGVRDTPTVWQIWLDYVFPHVAWISLAVFAGAMLAGPFRHWKSFHIWVAWLLVLLCCASWELFLAGRDALTNWLLTDSTYTSIAVAINSWNQNLIGAAILYVASFAGIPLGRLFMRSAERSRSIRWRKRLRKKRAKRRAG